MQRWKVVLLVIGIVALYATVAWNDNPADYVAPVMYQYFTGVVDGQMAASMETGLDYDSYALVPGVFSVTDPECSGTGRPCRGYMVLDHRLAHGQVVTLQIGHPSEDSRVLIKGGGYINTNIKVVDINKGIH